MSFDQGSLQDLGRARDGGVDPGRDLAVYVKLLP